MHKIEVRFLNIVFSYSLADLVVQGDKKHVLAIINSNPLTNPKSVQSLLRNDDLKVIIYAVYNINIIMSSSKWKYVKIDRCYAFNIDIL